MLEHLILVAFLQVSAPGVSAPNAAAAPEAKPPEMICKTERMTGSNIRKQRVCMTKEEYAAVVDRAQDLMRTLHNGANVQPKPPPSPLAGPG